jgi:tetratricopeptide (TPR) repeat protein
MSTFQNLWLSLVMLPAVCFFAGSVPSAERPVQANPIGSNLAWFFQTTSMFAKAPQLYQQAQDLFQAGRYEQAIATLDQALAFDSKYSAAWALRANALAELKRYPEALSDFDTAVKLGADKSSMDAAKLGSVWFARGNTLLSLKRYQGAVVSFDQAIALEPDNASAWLRRGNALYALKRYPEAIAAYDTALKISPDYQQAIYNRVLLMKRVEQERQFEQTSTAQLEGNDSVAQ